MSYSSGSISGRPPSVASSSSTRSQPKPPERAKTPTSARPHSRQSDVFTRSSSRTGRAFEVGDNVRIESLGFEGALRYLGEIDGKPGLWAGVELSGGFAGKGKNHGSVGTYVYISFLHHGLLPTASAARLISFALTSAESLFPQLNCLLQR
jgi:hypothetical protein